MLSGTCRGFSEMLAGIVIDLQGWLETSSESRCEISPITNLDPLVRGEFNGKCSFLFTMMGVYAIAQHSRSIFYN